MEITPLADGMGVRMSGLRPRADSQAPWTSGLQARATMCVYARIARALRLYGRDEGTEGTMVFNSVTLTDVACLTQCKSLKGHLFVSTESTESLLSQRLGDSVESDESVCQRVYSATH